MANQEGVPENMRKQLAIAYLRPVRYVHRQRRRRPPDHRLSPLRRRQQLLPRTHHRFPVVRRDDAAADRAPHVRFVELEARVWPDRAVPVSRDEPACYSTRLLQSRYIHRDREPNRCCSCLIAVVHLLRTSDNQPPSHSPQIAVARVDSAVGSAVGNLNRFSLHFQDRRRPNPIFFLNYALLLLSWSLSQSIRCKLLHSDVCNSDSFSARYLFTLKGYVRTRSRPEGSIAEGYWLEECVTFCSRYLNNDVETKLNRPFRLDDGGDSTRNSVQKLYEEGDEALSEEIISLAMGPLKKAERYTGYVINGFKYHTKARESNRITQHSGVMVKANTDSYASARDMNPIAGDVSRTSFDIWLMIEYGVAESWTKQFTIGPLVQVKRPILFWKHELLLEKANGQLVSCDLKSQRLKEFQVYGAQESFRAVAYSESLVSIKQASDIN
ncbi:hypothetical protein RJ640_001779 [Escallonia rubra]|uniref:DUF4218 domain-containing protein n=1 Tax=Escallonia rubra TaxID=112253 RepID=A0AA88QEN2_9ASTE|nr:hypothetical protein RJ640_001779 [Escallonia rubra]